MDIVIKRIYEKADQTDGYRILVDRLWPRGIKKTEARLDEWNKLVPPSSELRKWFAHQPERFSEFAHKYRKELEQQQEELKRIKKIGLHTRVTLLYGARNPQINHAIILSDVLKHTRV